MLQTRHIHIHPSSSAEQLEGVCKTVHEKYKEGVREPKSMLRASWGINSSAEAAGHHATHPAAAETCFLQSGLPQVRNKIIPGNPLSLGLASFYS